MSLVDRKREVALAYELKTLILSLFPADYTISESKSPASSLRCFLLSISHYQGKLNKVITIDNRERKKEGKEKKYLFIDNFSFLLFRTFNNEARCLNKNIRKNKQRFFSMFSMVNWTNYPVLHRKSFVSSPHLHLLVNSSLISKDNVLYENFHRYEYGT